MSISLMIGICEESDCDIDDGDDVEDDLSDQEGTPKRRRLVREEALEQCGLYPQFSGCDSLRDRPSYLIQVKMMSLHLCSWFGQHLCVN